MPTLLLKTLTLIAFGEYISIPSIFKLPEILQPSTKSINNNQSIDFANDNFCTFFPNYFPSVTFKANPNPAQNASSLFCAFGLKTIQAQGFGIAKCPLSLKPAVKADFLTLEPIKASDLKTTTAFQGLMDSLAGTEARINTARKDYNDAVQPFNQKVQTFPTNIVAGLMGFQTLPYFEADANASKAPTVNFGE